MTFKKIANGVLFNDNGNHNIFNDTNAKDGLELFINSNIDDEYDDEVYAIYKNKLMCNNEIIVKWFSDKWQIAYYSHFANQYLKLKLIRKGNN